ncbi:snRNA-activating protein complex subunit 3 [Turdus rufiventris]|nr:snRNA-activating protein complex subunit 3 [Turdus rufiventris]
MAADVAAAAAAAEAPDYEAAELYTRAFRVGALGLGWRRLLGPPDLSLAEEEAEEADAAVAAALGCTPSTAAELRAVCSSTPKRYSLLSDIIVDVGNITSIDMLMSSEKEEDPDVIPEDSSLLTLRYAVTVLSWYPYLGIRKKALEKREETIIVDRACRQETLAYEMESHATGKRPDNPTDLIEEGELLLTLNIFYPVIFQKHKDHKPYQTVLVLGSQKLTELRDSISCVSDLQIGGEFSSQPDQAPEHISKELYKSAFFYLEGIFYNDKRYPECRDLSRTIIEWSESHDRGYENFQSVKMEDYVFNDLSLKIGFPYLYCHQGNCEHIIIITDIRWVTNRDSLAPEDPCFFCDVCFRMLHYDAEGNKLGEFLAYPYVDPGIFN